MKKLFCFLFLIFTVIGVYSSCDKNVFFEDVDRRVFEYILRDTEKGDVEISGLDAYFRENDYYYHIRYSCVEDGERKDWSAVYRCRRHGSVTMYYNLNWEDDSIILPMKDDFFDAVDYGDHKLYSEKEIEKYVEYYYKNK